MTTQNYSFPGHALHEKGLQKQNGDGPLVSSQEQRALLAPRKNLLSTGCQPVVVFLHLFKPDFVCSCFWGDVQAMCLRWLGGCEGRLSLGRTFLSASNPAGPRPAASPCAPTRPARGMFGFLIRQVFFQSRYEIATTLSQLRPTPLPLRAAAPCSVSFPSGLGFDRFPDIPCMKKAYRDKWVSGHWSAARNEERPPSLR